MDSTEISQNVLESLPDGWPDWVLISLSELEASESALATDTFIDSLSDWSKSMLEEIIKPMLPKIKWKADGQTGVEFLGKIIGHQEYLFESDEE